MLHVQSPTSLPQKWSLQQKAENPLPLPVRDSGLFVFVKCWVFGKPTTLNMIGIWIPTGATVLPWIFKSKENCILLFSYLDDYLGGAGFFQGSLQNAIQHSLNQVTYIQSMGLWLGLTFKRQKMEVPQSYQALLGITLDLLQRNLSLKPGKAVKVADMIDDILSHLMWDKKSLQSLCGNTVWLSCLLPRIRAYITPPVEMTKRIPGKTGAIQKGTFPVLDAEMTRALQFLKEIFAIDPAVHIYKYLNLLPINKCVIWSDASGYVPHLDD